MQTVEQFIREYIPRWEGRPGHYYSDDPNDNGNWYLPGAKAQKKGQGILVGSNFGVTGATLAAFLMRRNITATDMKSLTLETAATIARGLFFDNPGLKNLVWNQVTASVMDFGWGAGPAASVKLLQDMLDAPVQDGHVDAGGTTAKLFAAFCGSRGVDFAAGAWWALREEYYEDLVVRRPSDAIYLHGWDNRSAYFVPGHAEGWWNRFGK